MKYFYRFFCLVMALVALISCEKYNAENEIIVDPFTYGKKFNFREVSLKTGNGDWTAIENGNVFAWLGGATTLSDQLQIPKGFAIYNDRSNLQADFIYTIAKDSVFSFRIYDDSLYFFDESKENLRPDLKGEIVFSPDTSIILYNTGKLPSISIKYRFER